MVPIPLHDPYWKLLHCVMEYAVDSTPEVALYLGKKLVGRIDETVFVKHLYVPRSGDELEGKLERHILEEGRPIACVAAARGAGKTSTIRYVVHHIKEEHPDVRVELFDFKRLYDQHQSGDISNANAVQAFRKLIRQAVQARLFPDDTCKFFAWAASGPPDNSDSFDPDIYHDLHDLFEHVIKYTEYDGAPIRKQRFEFLRNWFSARPAEYAHLYERYAPDLRAAHVLQAAVNLLDYRRIVIVYDNADRIPARHQPFFLEVINDGHNAVAGVAGTVIAIRNENLRGPKPRANEGADIIDVMLLDEREYPCLVLPRVKDDHTTEVLERRKAFAEKLYSEHQPTAELKDIVLLHKGTVGELINIQIHRLANESMRAVANAYSGFMRYLHRLRDLKHITFEELFHTGDEGRKYLRTIFFLWVLNEGAEYGLDLHDAVIIDNVGLKNADIQAIACPHHLLVTCVLNLSAKHGAPSNRRYPEFHQVFSRMKELGFDLAAVRRALDNLCAVPGSQARTLEFHETEVIIGSLKEDSTDRLRPTLAGEELATNVCCKVGYIWGRSHLHEDSKKSSSVSYFQKTTPQRVRVLYHYLVQMARGQLHLLSRVRTRWLPKYKQGWLKEYREMFGIHGRLQIERILESAVSFYGNRYKDQPNNPFIVLRETYDHLLSQLQQEGLYKETDQTDLERGWRYIVIPGDKASSQPSTHKQRQHHAKP